MDCFTCISLLKERQVQVLSQIYFFLKSSKLKKKFLQNCLRGLSFRHFHGNSSQKNPWKSRAKKHNIPANFYNFNLQTFFWKDILERSTMQPKLTKFLEKVVEKLKNFFKTKLYYPLFGRKMAKREPWLLYVYPQFFSLTAPLERRGLVLFDKVPALAEKITLKQTSQQGD